MCQTRRSVLCVKDSLAEMVIVTKNINRISNEIEKYINRHVNITETFDSYVLFEMAHIHAQLPTPQHHVLFIESSNINKVRAPSIFILFF